MGVLLFVLGRPKIAEKNEQSGKKQSQWIALLGIILIAVFLFSFHWA
jgi:hypothetical protein